MTNDNIVDIRTDIAVRKMEDWRIKNFIWYFENYDSAWVGKLRDEIWQACVREAIRRGI